MTNWRDIQEQAEKFVFDYKEAKDEDRDAKPLLLCPSELYAK